MFRLRLASCLTVCLFLVTAARAQWEIQRSGTSAELRGIDNVGGGVAWASGTEGTVLRTDDYGEHWRHCAIPAGETSYGTQLDFRGVQGLDAKTALVMASGRGSMSRIYKTTDACRTWRLVLANMDKDGYFDALKMTLPLISMKAGAKQYQGRVIGDAVRGRFARYETTDSGDHWTKIGDGQFESPSAEDGEAIFAASNSSLLYFPNGSELFVTGGLIGARSRVIAETIRMGHHTMRYVGGYIPVAAGTGDTGAFSVAIASEGGGAPHVAPDNKEEVLYVDSGTLVTVGGNDLKPGQSKGTAAFSTDSGVRWTAATTPPHGYRSSVAYDAATKMFIAVGLNGTDISIDNGRDWSALTPARDEAADADKNWNALSLPFVVGPRGRIGVLRTKPRTFIASELSPD
jgi:photosystem II stability/assembly factor-like uncharacterized protein